MSWRLKKPGAISGLGRGGMRDVIMAAARTAGGVQNTVETFRQRVLGASVPSTGFQGAHDYPGARPGALGSRFI